MKNLYLLLILLLPTTVVLAFVPTSTLTKKQSLIVASHHDNASIVQRHRSQEVSNIKTLFRPRKRQHVRLYASSSSSSSPSSSSSSKGENLWKLPKSITSSILKRGGTSDNNQNVNGSSDKRTTSNSSNVNTTSDSTSILSAFLLIALDIFMRRLFQQLSISFPSSLAGCCALFVTMITISIPFRGSAETIFKILSPGAALLAKWLPVFFVPSLITLPLAGGFGTASELIKALGIVVGGFYFTLLSTAGSVVTVRNLSSKNNNKTEKTTTTKKDNNNDDDKDNNSVNEIKNAANGDTTTPATTTMKTNGKSSSSLSPTTATKPFSDELTNRLRGSVVLSGIAAALLKSFSTTATTTISGPVSSIFMLLLTLHNFVFGARLPKKFTKVVHPLVTCTALTWTVAAMFATITKTTFTSMLKTYRRGSINPLIAAGAGDVLLFLLGPAVISLAVSMYDRRKLMRENFKEVVTAVGVSSFGGLFGTAMAVRLLQIGNPYLRLSLLSRNITSPLAMAIADIIGADVSLAVSMVVITGLIGANFGASILNMFGIKNAVARGLGIGAAAHGLGTAAFVNEKDAFPFAAISMALTATTCTVLVSIPIIKKILLQLALGV